MFNSDYLFPVGFVRACEGKLLTKSDFLKLKSSVDVEQFKINLKSLNYDFVDFSNSSDFNLVLNNMFSKIVSYFIRICPKQELFEILFFKNDCHNLRTILMADFFKFDFKNLILEPNFLSIKLIEDCVSIKNFDLMPCHFRKLALTTILMLNNDSFEQFELFNKFNKNAFQIKMQLCLNECDKFLYDRTRLEIDIFNLNLVLKILKLNLSKNVLNECLVDGGFVDCFFIAKVFNEGIDSLDKFFKLNFNVDLLKLTKSPEFFNLFVFEKFFEYDFKYCNSPFSFAAIVSYLTNLKHEHEILRRILAEIILKRG